MYRHRLQGRLKPAEAVARKDRRKYERHIVRREREQQKGREHRCVAGVYEHSLTLSVGVLAEGEANYQQHDRHYREEQPTRGECIFGGVFCKEVFKRAESQHEYQCDRRSRYGETGAGDYVGGDRRRRGVRQRKRRAVHHPEHKGEEDHRRGHIAQRHQHHPAKTYREDRSALSVVEHPADERAAEYRNE